MKLKIEVCGKSDVGMVRAKNEDSMLIDEELALFIVADGMGGHVGGKMASSLAVKRIPEYIKEHLAELDKEVANMTSLETTGIPRILADAVRKICFVQYFLHLQLGKAAQLARSKGVVLKADLPVAPYRDSVATWLEPEKFNLDMQLGTPPTPSAPSGQVWGFATTKPAYRQHLPAQHRLP